MTYEHCTECDAETGRAGKYDDSLYHASEGPYCVECYESWAENMICERDALAAANADLQLHFDTLKDDRDDQYDMKVKAREQRDAVTAENKRLREALTPELLDWIKCGLATNGRLVDGSHPALEKLQAALTTANKEPRHDK